MRSGPRQMPGPALCAIASAYSRQPGSLTAGELLAQRLQRLVGRERAVGSCGGIRAGRGGGVTGAVGVVAAFGVVAGRLDGLDVGLGGVLDLLLVRLPACVRLGV